MTTPAGSGWDLLWPDGVAPGLVWPPVLGGCRVAPLAAPTGSVAVLTRLRPPGAAAEAWAPRAARDLVTWAQSDEGADELAWLDWVASIPASGDPRLRHQGAVREPDGVVWDGAQQRLWVLPDLDAIAPAPAGTASPVRRLSQGVFLRGRSLDQELLWLAAVDQATRRGEVWTPMCDLLMATRPKPDVAGVRRCEEAASLLVREWIEEAEYRGLARCMALAHLQTLGLSTPLLDAAGAPRADRHLIAQQDARVSALFERLGPPRDPTTLAVVGWWMRQPGPRHQAVQSGPLPPPSVFGALMAGLAWGHPTELGTPLRGDTTWGSTVEHVLARADLTAAHVRAIADSVRPPVVAPRPLVAPGASRSGGGGAATAEDFGFVPGWRVGVRGTSVGAAGLHQLVSVAERLAVGPLWPDLARELLARVGRLDAQIAAELAGDAPFEARATRALVEGPERILGLDGLELLGVVARQSVAGADGPAVERALAHLAAWLERLETPDPAAPSAWRQRADGALMRHAARQLRTAWALQPETTPAAWAVHPGRRVGADPTLGPVLAQHRRDFFLRVVEADWIPDVLAQRDGGLGHGQDALLASMLADPHAGTELWRTLFPPEGVALLNGAAGGEKRREQLLRRLVRQPEVVQLLRQARYLGPWLKCGDRTLREFAVRVMGQTAEAPRDATCVEARHL